MSNSVFQGRVDHVVNGLLFSIDKEFGGRETAEVSWIRVELPQSLSPDQVNRLLNRRVVLCFPGED